MLTCLILKLIPVRRSSFCVPLEHSVATQLICVLFVAFLSMLSCSFSSKAFAEEVINLYSARHYDTDFELYARFTKETGIKVNLIEGGSDALIERILSEGELSPADLLITVDAGRLWRADEAGLFQSAESKVLEMRIPENLRHPLGHWFGLSKRARVIVTRKGSGLESIKNYEELSHPRLVGKVCMRSSSNIYNLSLMASLIDSNGIQMAETWAKGVVRNFARRPQGNDTAQIKAVASGECGVTVANTYYLGRMFGSNDPELKQITENLQIIFPNQNGRGAHVNISGGGVVRHAPNKENAIRFLEYLTEPFAQRLFAEGNNEYPIIGAVTGSVALFGSFSEDSISSSRLGELQADAVRVYDRAGWF